MSIAPHFDLTRVFERDNIQFRTSAGSLFSKGMLGVGGLFIILTVGGALAGDVPTKSIALHSFFVGAIVVLGFSLGALAFHMICNVTNAGWTALLRKQFENIMSLTWLGCLFVLAAFLFQALLVNTTDVVTDKAAGVYAPFLWNWMDPNYRAGDPLYTHKQAFLNLPVFLLFSIVYAAVYIGLARALCRLARRQDEDASRWHTLTMGRLSAIGLVLYAFATMFAAFHWLMTLDYHWFSTMYGVYFFVGNLVSALALLTIVFIVLRTLGKLNGAFTQEHLHDLTKFLFGFIVFWAYIGFSQYFLIWYANIPEETAYFNLRRDNWNFLSFLLPIGHFILPFLVLIPRPARRNSAVVFCVCCWMILMHIVDVFWNIRPEAKAVPAFSWLDIVGILGPVLIFGGLLVRKIVSEPLVPLHDPRTAEGLDHKNYV
ncbi:MAG: hypothetical protein ACNA8P_02375 [Phycisphaerales bacterium]